MTKATFFRTAALAALIVMSMLARSTPVTAADPGEKVFVPAVQIHGDQSAQFVPLGVGKSIVVDLPGEIKDVLVADPAIANAVVRTSRRAYIIGVKVGQTNIYFFDAAGKQLMGFDIAVTRDLNGIRALARYVMRCTAPTDRLFMAGTFSPEVYFYAERPFAAGMVHFLRPWHASLPEQRLTIERLQRQSAPIALIGDLDSFHRGFPFVAEYVRTRYVEVAYSAFNGDSPWHVLVDNHREPVGTDPALGLPCYRPPGHE